MDLANAVRRQRAWECQMLVLKKIEDNPGVSGYGLAKILQWTPGKVDHYVKKLLKYSFITNSTTSVNGRTKNEYFAQPISHYIKEEKKELIH